MRHAFPALHRLLIRFALRTVLLCCLGASTTVNAHLMVAQRGTINFVGDGAFMVLSLPVSAFVGVDDDGDGKLSAAELAAHSDKLFSAVMRDVQLIDANGVRPLEGLMLSLSSPDETPNAPASQIVVLGRFALAAGGAHAAAPDSTLSFRVALFGKEELERRFQVTVTRNPQSQLLTLTLDRPQRSLFPPPWAVFTGYVAMGAEHIAMGFDHLLFLLVVLAAGWGWRFVLIALTTFTVGHAITLTISVLGGVFAPASIVEPIIALTIAAMALFDLLHRTRGREATPWLRLGLVFICSLVHGLGLASSLTDLGLDNQHRLLSLAGFNVGIELAQLAIAVVVATTAIAIRNMLGEIPAATVGRFASFAAVIAGTGWFVQRMIGPA